MIEGLNGRIFSENISTLEKCSWDDAKNEFPSRLSIGVFDFDAVSDKYREELEPAPKGRIPSVDALVPCDDGRIVLVEFKNREVGGSLEKEVKAKVFSSLLLLSDVCGLSLDDMRSKVDFVLVYKEKAKEAVCRLACGKAGERYVHRNLDTLEGFCFRRVETYPVEEFDKAFRRVCTSELDRLAGLSWAQASADGER